MAELLKNIFSRQFIKELGTELKNSTNQFDEQSFQIYVLDKNWNNRELKDRMHKVTQGIFENLPLNYTEQLKALKSIAPKFRGLTGTVFPNFVEHYGLSDEDQSIDALKFFTEYSTSEFAIRPFLKRNPKLIEVLYQWAEDENFHVRRLATEGCRPLLPWAIKLDQYVLDPSPILPILEKLKNDPEDYVHRSVANNLNDISKHHADLVLNLGKKWKGKTETTDWVLKHGLRTLLKKGNSKAMNLFGFGQDNNYKIIAFRSSKKSVQIGESIKMQISLQTGNKSSKIRLEYMISFLKKNGSYSKKVFQIFEKTLESNSNIELEKKHDFRNLSTRKHYPGKHMVFLKLNGVAVADFSIELKQPNR